MAQQPWDKLSTESDESYARFLTFRNLGPFRSLKKAYFHFLKEFDGFQGDAKRISIPGHWRDDCRFNFWCQRAAAWDVRNLSNYGQQIVALHSEAIVAIAKKNLRAAHKFDVGDKGWFALQASIRTVAEYLTPELLKNVQQRTNGDKPALEPTGAGKPVNLK